MDGRRLMRRLQTPFTIRRFVVALLTAATPFCAAAGSRTDRQMVSGIGLAADGHTRPRIIERKSLGLGCRT